MGGVTKPLGGRNLLIDTQNHKSSNWVVNWGANNADNGTLFNSRIYKTNTKWDGMRFKLQNLLDRNVLNTTDVYTWSIYVKKDSDVVIDSSNLYFFTGNGMIEKVSNIDFSTIDEEWSQLSISIRFNTLTPSDKPYIGFETSKEITDGYIYWACPQLERGSTASEYQPAPEDIASDTTNIQQQLAVLTTKIAQLESAKS